MSTRRIKGPDAAHYTYTVRWSEEDAAYIGTVAEFASLAAHGGTELKALHEVHTLVSAVLEDLQGSGEPIPKPYCEQSFSGKLNLRMPSYLHRQLAIEAAQYKISLNQLINLRLASGQTISLAVEAPKEKRKAR